MDIKNIQSLVSQYTRISILDKGSSFSAFRNYKDYANHRISHNILRKAVQLVNDLNGVRVKDSSPIKDQVSESVSKILSLRAKALEISPSKVRADLRDFLGGEDLKKSLRGSSLDKDV